MACTINVDLTRAKALQALYDYCGTNCSMFYSYLTTVVKDINTKGELEFREAFAEQWKGKEPLDINTSDPAKVKDAIIKYYNKKYPNAEDSYREVKGFNKITGFGYKSISAREEAKRDVANFMTLVMKALQERGERQTIVNFITTRVTKAGQAEGKNEKQIANRIKQEIRERYNHYRKVYCAEQAIAQMKKELAKRLSAITGVSEKEIRKNLTDNNAVYIDNLISGHESSINVQLENLIASVKELITTDIYKATGETKPDGVIEVDSRKEFIEEIFWDSRLAPIRYEGTINADDMQAEEAQDENNENSEDPDPENESKEAEYNTYIRTLDNKLGTYTTFMAHISIPIRVLLGSLKKANPSQVDPKVFTLDTDNNLGIPDLMDANACATVLYHMGRFNNIEDMMNSIQEISRAIPGFGAFDQLHHILSGNPNLQLEFFRTFSKVAIGKVETVVENGRSISRITNNLDKESIIKYKLLNHIKGTSLSFVEAQARKAHGLLVAKVKMYNDTNDADGVKLRSLCNELAQAFRTFYPDIDELSIRNFVLLNENGNGVVNRKENLQILVNNLNTTIEGAVQTLENYRTKRSKIDLIRHNHYIAQLERNKGNDAVSTDTLDLSDIYAESYISLKSEEAAIQLTKQLKPYTLVNSPLNSRNVHGNQSSDIINISMLTNVKSILESELNNFTEVKENGVTKRVWDENSPIVKLANHRFHQSQNEGPDNHQYDFSNMLVEHRDEQGNIVNRGLFRFDEELNKYVPTEYSTNMLQVRLFNGASNLEDGTNILYSEMSKGDYIGTAWRMFFNPSSSIGGVEKSAEYFMRIPSDAPKTFAITAPRYSASGLLTIGNASEINKEITDFLNEVDNLAIVDLKSEKALYTKTPIYVGKHSGGLNMASMVEHVQAINGNTTTIRIPLNRQGSLKESRDTKVKIAFRYASAKDASKTDNVYIMEGYYYEGALHDAEFKGFVKDDEHAFRGEVWTDIRRALWNNRTKLVGTTGAIAWKINSNHQIVKQLTNVFMQELTDMATAATVLFETVRDKNGNIRIKVDDNGHPIIKKSDIVQSNTEHNGIHPIYHFSDPDGDGHGKIYDESTGKATGKVFTSDRFILYNFFAENEDEAIRNFGQEILDEAFNLFKTRTTDSNTVLQFDENGNVILTDVQREAIQKGINDFILAYVDHATKRLQNVESFVGLEQADITDDGDYISDATNKVTNIADFILNTHLTYVGFNDMFEGDTKFYKNTQTFLKRAKESQGSGVPYGTNDFTREFQPGHNKINSPLSAASFTKIVNGKIEDYPIEMYDTFSGITIYNTIKTDDYMLQALKRHLTNKDLMGNSVLTDEQADTLLYGPNGKGGYQNTTVNDAQSYITFDEWVRRITARGQLPKYKPLIDRILDEDTPLTVDDIQEFVQVQKNFYYDQYYNPKTKTVSPRQIKNAEYVLVPRFIRGTELEKVEKMMRTLGVDQLNTVETSKAGHSERFTLWDQNGHISQDIMDDIDGINPTPKSEIMRRGRDAREFYNYNYLYTQQETPQHMDAANKAGIQVMKKIVDNIDENSPKELQDAKREFFECYADKIRRSFVKLMNRFNVKLDENGNIDLDESGNIKGINYKIFYEALKDELTRLGLDSNMVDYCTLPDDAITPTGTIMPNYMSLVASKFENIVQSLFNNSITRQTLPGFHAAQVTGMGFRPLSQIIDKHQTSNILKYHPIRYKDNKGNTLTERDYEKLSKEEQSKYKEDGVEDYIEIALPASAFGIDRNADRYRGLSKEQQDELILKDLQKQGLDEIIGYRIPTEGKQSICKMKVVQLVDDAQGSTIVVPDAWVAQTGADFDIDSIYGIQYNLWYDTDGRPYKVAYAKSSTKGYDDYVRSHMTDKQKEQLKGVEGFNYDAWATDHGLESRDKWSLDNPETVISENSTQAIENRMLDLMKEMLTHPASFEENLSRSNFDDVTAALKKANKSNAKVSSQRAARTAYNIFDQADYQEDAMSGAKLKAFSVVRDTFCSICNTLKPTLENDAEIRVFYPSTYSQEELEKRFNKYDKDGKVIQRNVIPSTGGFTVIHRTFGWTNDNKNVDGKILTAYSSQTTAHILDAMKTGNVPNVNEHTFQVYKTLVDIGSNYDTSVSFIMQPGVRRIVDAYNETNSIYSPERGKNYVQKAIRSICDDLNIEYDYTDSIEVLVNKINHIYNATAEKMFGVADFDFSVNDADNAKLALNSDMQFARLAESGIFSDETPNEDRPDNITAKTARLLYDLQTILQYNKIDNLANNIREAARVTNPDKFGAKQSIFATREVFNTIVNSIKDNEWQTETDSGTNFRLQVEGKHLLSAIYPGVENYEKGDDVLDGILKDKDFVAKSKYKPLAAFLKYATATSVKINKTLFITQSDEFRAIIFDEVTGLASKLSNGTRMSEKTARSFQNYIVNYIVMQSEFLQAPLKYNMGRGGARGFEYLGKAPSSYNEEEATRVFGYWYPSSLIVQKTTPNTPASYSGKVTPDDNTVFVFGSNTEGRHGKGAAKVAVDQFGAVYGVSEGLRGKSYALPTKNLQVKQNNSLRSLNKSKIVENIRRMYDTAREHPTLQFKVYHIPLGTMGLAGYTGDEMLEMFKEAGDIPANVVFHEEWVNSGKLGQDIKIEYPFNVKDINDISQEEVDDFNRLSPAQKITWIQQNYRNPGVFRYIRTQLFTERGAKGNSAGIQSLHFEEEAADIETVRTEFYQAFTSKDPLIASAAADIIKYAFFVEGYTMRMGHVSKMIKNEALLRSGRIWGTNIIANSNNKMAMIDNVMQGKEENSNQAKVIENYIRSHSNEVGINTHSVTRTKNGYELPRREGDLIQVHGGTKVGKELAEKYGIAYENRRGKLVANAYTKLKFGKDTILYRIVEDKIGENATYYLIPLNLLEPNENAVFSANNNNNKYPKPEYYERLIDVYKTKLAAANRALNTYYAEEMKQAAAELKPIIGEYKAEKKKANKFESKPVQDINSNSKYDDLKQELNNWITSIDKSPIKFVWYSPFSKYLKGNKNDSVTQEVVINGVPHTLRITKVSLTNVLNSGKNFITRYTGKNANADIEEDDRLLYSELVELIKKVATYNADNHVSNLFGDIYAIEEVNVDVSQYDENSSPVEEIDEDDDEANLSSILDVASDSASAIYRRAINSDDPQARQISRNWNQQEISSTKESVSKNLDDVIITTAKYIEQLVNDIDHRLKYHIQDPETGNYLPVNDTKAIELIKKDPQKRQEYLRTLLEPQAVVDEFGAILELDIDSEDPNMKQYLDKIKAAVEKMQNNPIVADAYEKFAKQYYDKLTDNPLVKEGLISVLDGFYKTNWFNATFNDIQETSNPIVQIALRNLQSDLRAKQMQARRKVEEFVKGLEAIEKEAARVGKKVNYNNIIDEYGRFIKPHNDKFLEDRDKLQTAYKEAVRETDKAEETYGFNSPQHIQAKLKELEAKLEYDEWKVKHVELPVIDEYYKQKNEVTHIALFGYDTQELKDRIAKEEFGYPYDQVKQAYDRGTDLGDIDEEVLQLKYERVFANTIHREDIAKYENLRTKRAKLRQKYISDAENPELDKQIEEIDLAISKLKTDSSSEEGYSESAVNHYAQSLRDINNKYFKYEASYSFEEVLAENLRIIEAYEYGEKPYELYKNNPDYIKAKAWINRNTTFEADEEVREDLNDAYKVLSDPDKSDKVWHIRHNKDYFNKEGVFDPRLVPDEQLEKIKRDQLIQYSVPYATANSENDRKLISNGPESDAIYTKAFYDGITGGVKSARSGLQEYTWQEAVNAINKVLSKYYDVNTQRVRLDHIPNNDAGLEDLKTLKKYYKVLENIKGGRKSNKVIQFIEQNVDEESYNKEQYDLDKVYARSLPASEFRSTMLDVIMTFDYKDRLVPNKFLYGTLKPKADKTQFIDEEKTRALRTIREYTERKLSKEWYEANVAARKSMTSEEYQAWVDKNCVYNPYSRAYEPLSIWWNTEINKGQGTYFPKYEQTNRVPREGHFTHKEAVKLYETGGWQTLYDNKGNLIFDPDLYDDETISPQVIESKYISDYDVINKNYKENGGHSENYKVGSNPEYDKEVKANKYELKAMELMQNTLKALANTQDAKRYLERGWLPARHKAKPNNARGWLQELAKTFGFANEPMQNSEWYEDVDYYLDTPPLMPMLDKVRGKGSKKVRQRPKRTKDETDAHFNQRIKEWEEEKAEIEKENLRIHKENLDNDWKNVISDFIVQASTYNAVQENKYELFYAKQLLKTHGAYIIAYNNKGQVRFKKDRRSSTSEDSEYLRRPDTKLIEQFDNQIRRVVYNQFKEPNNPKLLKWMSVLQSVTSAQYMMLNVKGGIANVTLGETQILGEAFAREFFDTKTYAKGKLFYNGGIHDYILHSGDDGAGTLQGAIIKFMDVVDYDEHTGVSRLTKDAYEIMRRVRDFGYTPQTAGEHGMQNSAMFTMMMSHRLVENPRAEELGQPKYKFQNLHEYVMDTHKEALLSILNNKEKEEFNAFVNRVSSDADAFKKYAWYQEDLATAFARVKLTREKQKEFIKLRDDLVKTRTKEFEDDKLHPTILSQLELGSDGKMAIKKDSLLGEIDKEHEDGTPSDALQLLANFKGRVIAVNKYIHGVYDKSGRAQFEKTFIGSLVMQYHKHLPLGLMKRYRVKGMWHEERGAITKGMYRSLYDYLSIPFRKHKDVLDLDEQEVEVAEGIQNIVKNVVDFALNFKLAYRMMPDYDRANIRRMRGDLCGVLAALFLTIAIKAGMDDDDEDGLFYNLALYETDRLATEAGQYIPFVAYTEAKKLWQSPVAAGSGITDLLSSANLLCHMLIDGDEFDGEYHSGKFAGESKLKVYIERRIPIWRGIKSSFIDIVDNNHYYKVGENILNWVDVNEKAEWIKKHF